MAAGALSNFGMQAPLFGPPGFLVNAAPHATQLAAAALLTIAMGWLSVGLAAAAGPLFRRQSESMAIGFISLAVVSCALKAVESIHLLAMLSLSKTYVAAAAPDAELFQALRATVSSLRNWTHFVQLISAGAVNAALYAGLFRCSLVPRALAAMGLSHLALASWLLAKGFREPSSEDPGQRWPAQAQPEP